MNKDQTQLVVVGARRRLTAAHVAKLRAAPGLTLTESEVNALFPDPDVGVTIEFRNEAGDVIDIEDLSPRFESEAPAAAYLDMLMGQILTMKARLHLYFTRHSGEDERSTEKDQPWLAGPHGPPAVSADPPRLPRSHDTGELSP